MLVDACRWCWWSWLFCDCDCSGWGGLCCLLLVKTTDFVLLVLSWWDSCSNYVFILSESRQSRVPPQPIGMLSYHSISSSEKMAFQKGDMIPKSPVEHQKHVVFAATQSWAPARHTQPGSFEMSKVRCGDVCNNRKTLKMWMHCGGAHRRADVMG